MGCPINKTNAPRVYNKLFEVLNMNAIMLPVEIQKGHLPEFMDACRLNGVHYICPTMPHKADFIPLLDDVDEVSRLFRSVNCIRLDENGSHGAGMDGKGAVRAIENSGAKLDGITAMMYGSGGISGVFGYELSQRNVKKLYITNRSLDKANDIADILRNNTPMEVEVIAPEADLLDRAAENCQLFANMTPLGMCGFPATHDYLGFIDRMPKTATVFDCIINPPKSETILAGDKNGLNTVPGMQKLAPLDMEVTFFDMVTRYFHYTESTRNSKVANLLSQYTKEVTGLDRKAGGSGLSDLPLFTLYGSPNALGYGIARPYEAPGGAHQKDEFVLCDDLVNMAKVVGALMLAY